MSRTYRDRPFKLLTDENVSWWLEHRTEKELLKKLYQFYGDSHSGDYNTKKSIRKVVEKWRRARNKQEVFKAVKFDDHIPNIQPCNGKDNHSWHYD